MKLIADSGSTKTNWSLFDDKKIETCQTAGMNPYHQDKKAMITTLKNEFTLKSHPDSIFFYGAGFDDQRKKNIITDVLTKFFNTKNINIESDLMAAARSLCQDKEGIACILGTGSNSCHYDGKNIINHVPSLGYILGDEGSGSVLGIKLISDIFKNQAPEHITKLFFQVYPLTQIQILENLYKKPFPNRFAASFTKFIHENLHEEYMVRIVKNGFYNFFSRNIFQYSGIKSLPVHFTGSIAYYFKDILQEIASDFKIKIGTITQSPVLGLIEYHKKH